MSAESASAEITVLPFVGTGLAPSPVGAKRWARYLPNWEVPVARQVHFEGNSLHNSAKMK
jgi:hypothetical protein